MHVIIDYQVGNLKSVQEGFKRAGIATMISRDPAVIRQASSLILPGVGAFEASIRALQQSGLIPLILDHIQRHKFLLGICLGMQLLYEASEEFGYHQGLGIFKGVIKKIPQGVMVPHMGWNTLVMQTQDPLFKYLKQDRDVYFVHSFYAASTDGVIATTSHGVSIPSIVKKGNVYATQFHPEKSGDVGHQLLLGYGSLL
jgi:glutamine amidotransferase